MVQRYRVEHEVGRGGMATVYRARDLRHDRSVAVKVLDPELAGAVGPERFLREITLTARLDHPHILPLLDSGESDGFLYYVMPFVDGESLRDRMNRERQLPLGAALEITREVADALSYAHSLGIAARPTAPSPTTSRFTSGIGRAPIGPTGAQSSSHPAKLSHTWPTATSSPRWADTAKPSNQRGEPRS